MNGRVYAKDVHTASIYVRFGNHRDVRNRV